jgi:uncharacterized protein
MRLWDSTYMPVLTSDGLRGGRCVACGRCSSPATWRCAWCGGEITPDTFEPVGEVWASTVVHIPVGGRTPPFGLAYVDIFNGPRVLGVQVRPEILPAGQRVRLQHDSDDGSWRVVEED